MLLSHCDANDSSSCLEVYFPGLCLFGRLPEWKHNRHLLRQMWECWKLALSTYEERWVRKGGRAKEMHAYHDMINIYMCFSRTESRGWHSSDESNLINRLSATSTVIRLHHIWWFHMTQLMCISNNSCFRWSATSNTIQSNQRFRGHVLEPSKPAAFPKHILPM